jgi:nitrogen fixation NifU-like protein
MTQTFEYGKSVMKRFLKPKFAGEIKNADGVGQVGNAACGDIMRVFIKVKKNNKNQRVIEDIKFKTMGCVAAIASSDAVCEIAKGKSIEDARKITKKKIMERVGKLPQIKHHCSILGEEALISAINDYESKEKKKN